MPNPPRALDDRLLGAELIFLLGLPRSGTTLLQLLLAQHADICTTGEPWLMLPLSGLLSDSLSAEYDSSLAQGALRRFSRELPGGRATVLDAVRRLAITLYAARLDESGARYFLDKTPRYHYIIPELLEVFPAARYIVLRRNPLSVLASVAESWFDGNVPAALADPYHQRDLTIGPDHLDAGTRLLDARAQVLNFDDLVQDPRATLQRLSDSLGISFHPDMLRYDPHRLPEDSFGDRFGIPSHTQPHTASIERWTDVLFRAANFAAARAYLLSIAPETFRAIGLDRDELEARFDRRGHELRAAGEL